MFTTWQKWITITEAAEAAGVKPVKAAEAALDADDEALSNAKAPTKAADTDVFSSPKPAPQMKDPFANADDTPARAPKVEAKPVEAAAPPPAHKMEAAEDVVSRGAKEKSAAERKAAKEAAAAKKAAQKRAAEEKRAAVEKMADE